MDNSFVGESVNALYYYEVAGYGKQSEAAEAEGFGYEPVM